VNCADFNVSTPYLILPDLNLNLLNLQFPKITRQDTTFSEPEDEEYGSRLLFARFQVFRTENEKGSVTGSEFGITAMCYPSYRIITRPEFAANMKAQCLSEDGTNTGPSTAVTGQLLRFENSAWIRQFKISRPDLVSGLIFKHYSLICSKEVLEIISPHLICWKFV